MAFKIYDKRDDIPEALRGDYRESKNGKWVPDLSEDHPVITKKKELLTNNATLTQTNTNLTAEKVALEGKVVPSGKRIIDLDEHRLLESFRSLNLPFDQIKARLDEYPTLKEKEETRALDELLDKVARDMKYENALAFRTAMKSSKLKPEQKVEKVDDKDVMVWYVGDKRLSDYIQNSPELKSLEPAFKVIEKKKAPATEAGKGTGPVGGDNGNPPAPEAKGQPEQTFIFQNPGDVAWK